MNNNLLTARLGHGLGHHPFVVGPHSWLKAFQQDLSRGPHGTGQDGGPVPSTLHRNEDYGSVKVSFASSRSVLTGQRAPLPTGQLVSFTVRRF